MYQVLSFQPLIDQWLNQVTNLKLCTDDEHNAKQVSCAVNGKPPYIDFMVS
jgi:hypothetical protein